MPDGVPAFARDSKGRTKVGGTVEEHSAPQVTSTDPRPARPGPRKSSAHPHRRVRRWDIPTWGFEGYTKVSPTGHPPRVGRSVAIAAGGIEVRYLQTTG